jgi:hypothetical protein
MTMLILGAAALVLAAGAIVWFVLSGKKHGPGQYDIGAEDVATYQIHDKDQGGLHG